MKGKFGAIAKVKKQLLDRREIQLLEARTKAQKIQGEIEAVQATLNAQKVPQKGTYASLLHVKAVAERLGQQKQYLLEDKDAAQAQANECLYHYKEARKEFEKMKYLEEKEYSQWLKMLKKQEQLHLDEVALQLYAQGGKE
jgi:flagellar export protein FliJ